MSVVEQLESGCLSTSPKQTRSIAAQLAKGLPRECTLALSGSLGTGKTTFAQGLARGFGIEKNVTSPTFNLFVVYDGERRLIHFDAYRLETAAEAEDLLIEEFLEPPYCLAVEWPEKVFGWLPEPLWFLSFEVERPGEHRIKLDSRA